MKSSENSRNSRTIRARVRHAVRGYVPLAVFGGVVLAQLPLLLNPGYFSHDELQWAAFAATSPGVPWTGFDTFQYRPLTFNLWLWLSRTLFAQPVLLHAVIVAMGAANAAMLAALLRRRSVRPWPAGIGALAFALGPYAMYVHGWVATLGDVLWVGCGLGIGLITATTRPVAVAFAAALALTALALLAKEAAVVIPALLGLAWLFDRRRRWLWATLGAALATAVYLALRLPVLWDVPADAGQYAWSVQYLPLRWLEYQLYPILWDRFEVYDTLGDGFATEGAMAAGAVWLAVGAGLWRAGGRWLLGFVAATAIALGPALLLPAAANQYAYGFAATAAGVIAAAWAHAPRWGRLAIALLALASLRHGLEVMGQVREVGEIQAVFSPALAAALRQSTEPVLQLRPEDPAQAWIYLRLTHRIPSYRGVPIGDRVRLVDGGEAADFVIQRDGRLRPAAG